MRWFFFRKLISKFFTFKNVLFSLECEFLSIYYFVLSYLFILKWCWWYWFLSFFHHSFLLFLWCHKLLNQNVSSWLMHWFNGLSQSISSISLMLKHIIHFLLLNYLWRISNWFNVAEFSFFLFSYFLIFSSHSYFIIYELSLSHCYYHVIYYRDSNYHWGYASCKNSLLLKEENKKNKNKDAQE